MDSKIAELAQGWLKIDPNPTTRAKVQALVDAGDGAALGKAMGSRMAFGTAGLRGPMGAGYSCMNEVTVLQCTQGIVAYLQKTNSTDDLKTKGVVIGYDHRRNDTGVNSEAMALVAAAVCIHMGIKVFLYGKMVATPLVPFCVQHKGCAAGMMVTASHNPKDDNGYKMYGSNGAQLCEPHDTAISELILDNLAPWTDYEAKTKEVRSSTLCVEDFDGTSAEYFKQMAATLNYHSEDNAASDLKIVYTAMHGVGAPFAARAFAAFGLRPFVPVLEQNEADPTFPTVAYPNPEEGKGALQLAFDVAAAAGSSLVLANDPDADRLAVAEKQLDGAWKVFSGNEIGMLLAHWLFKKATAAGTAPGKLAVVASTVSSKMTRALAQKEGMVFEETLTGFKWICNKKFDLQQQGLKVVLAFEESIGFCCGDIVNDKDGVSAAAVFAEMAVQLSKAETSVAAHLDSLCDTYGHFVSRQGYVILPDPSLTAQIFDRLRPAPAGNGYPQTCGKFEIAHVRDLTTGYDSSTRDRKARLPASAASQHLTFTFANGAVANLRGSGTEPKLKYYVELHGPDRPSVTTELLDMVKTIVGSFLEPERNALKWGGVE